MHGTIDVPFDGRSQQMESAIGNFAVSTLLCSYIDLWHTT